MLRKIFKLTFSIFAVYVNPFNMLLLLFSLSSGSIFMTLGKPTYFLIGPTYTRTDQGCSGPSVLFVCLSAAYDPKLFKLGIGNDLGIS